MREPSKTIWYQLGYALESARHGARSARKVRSADKTPQPEEDQPARRRPVSSTVDQLVTTGAGLLADRLFSIVAGRQPGGLRLAHAALAGAGASLALSLFRNGKNGTAGAGQGAPDPTAELLSGAARGILYGAVLEPRLPGSALLRGATFGVMEYVTSPFGGLDGILGAGSPHRTMPILAALLGTGDAMAGSVLDHVAFGVTLGLLYGVGSERSGNLIAE